MGARATIAFLLGVAVAAPVAVRAQPGPITPRVRPGQTEERPRVNLRADANLVLVPVQVTDKQNRPVGGLAKENFEVYDDNVRQQIVSFAREDDPLALCIVYDVSSSVHGNTLVAWLMAHDVVLHANPGDELCAVTLASEAKLVMPLRQYDRPRDIDDSLLAAKGGGSTALLDGVYLALSELRKSKKMKRAMFVVSDGLENNSRYTEREVHNALKETDALIYAQNGRLEDGIGRFIGVGDKQVLPDLVSATGGLFLPDVDRVITDLRNRYVLGFAPREEAHDGRSHRITVKVTPPKGLPKVFTHWRTGYNAPLN